MPELKPSIQRTSLVLRDPRRYSLCEPNSLFSSIRRMDWRRAAFDFGTGVDLARTLIKEGELDQLQQALMCARDYDDHSAVQAVLTEASCLQPLSGGKVQVLFGIPVTLHPHRWPVTDQPRGEWLDFDALARTLNHVGIGRTPQRLKLLPHLFALPDLRHMSWVQWHKLGAVPEGDTAAALQLLPTPRNFEPVRTRSAQARMILGTLNASPAQAEKFTNDGAFREAELVAALVKELQHQYGGSNPRVVAGVPMLATAALSNGVHMTNLAQLSCIADLVREDVPEALSFQAQAITEDSGEGIIRFSTRSTHADWVMSKSEPWHALQMHWDMLLGGISSRYVRVQLGITR